MGLWSRITQGRGAPEKAKPEEAAAPTRPQRAPSGLPASSSISAADKLAGFHSIVKECLERALRFDEAGSPAEARRYYAQGVALATEALALNVAPPSAQTEQHRKQLQAWQQRAGERLRSLEARHQQQQQVRPDAKPSAADSGEEAKLRAAVESDIVDHSPGVSWADVAGLEEAKRALQEAVVLPSLRPDLFTGLRAPARGLLLFGPPGTGKTLLAKACATEAKSTFFSISASSLTSKWVGESEKLVRMLFTVARERSPTIVFIDEVDSVLSARSATENEATKRLKTEFLVQFDGVTSGGADAPRVVVLAATNRPGDIDEAVRRRLPRRIYVPLPDAAGRRALLTRLLGSSSSFTLPERDYDELVRRTEGYSGSDLAALCREAALAPLRELGDAIASVSPSKVRQLRLTDFTGALRVIRPSVARDQLTELIEWDKQFGSGT